MVSKGSIVGMFLDGHNLNGIISIFLNTWQYVFLKFTIRANLFGILSHSNVAFIDKQ